MLPLPSETHLKGLLHVSSTASSAGSHKEHCSPSDDSDSFYDKLVQLLESSGFTLMWVFTAFIKPTLHSLKNILAASCFYISLTCFPLFFRFISLMGWWNPQIIFLFSCCLVAHKMHCMQRKFTLFLVGASYFSSLSLFSWTKTITTLLIQNYYLFCLNQGMWVVNCCLSHSCSLSHFLV